MKFERKAILIVTWSSKKLKGMDNPLRVEKVCMITFWDSWFMKNEKANTATKVFLKKAAKAKKGPRKARSSNKRKYQVQKTGFGNKKVSND